MKASFPALGWIIAVCVMMPGFPVRGQDVSDAQFNALKELVRKQGEQMQKLEDQMQKLEQSRAADEQTHQKDLEQIRELQKRLGTNQQSAGNGQKEVIATVETQPIPRAIIDEATVNHNFIIVGDAEFQYAKASGQNGAFLLADFAPIFLYRGGDNILFEAGFDFGLQNNAPASPGATTTIDLSFAQLNYLMNDYVTFAAGDMLLPLGTYSQRSAGWLNKFPDDPLPRDLLPGSGVGAQLLGAVPVGSEGKLLNYSIYGVNGPSSADGTGNAGALDLGGNVGLRSDNTVANLHGNPCGGGRVGFFYPYKPHYDFEAGISGQSGEWIGGHPNLGSSSRGHLWSAAVLDGAVHLGSYFEAKGEYIRTWYGSDDFGSVKPWGWWVQAGYKLAGLDLAIPRIDNLELVGRYDVIHDGLGLHTDRYSVGAVYYLSNTLLLESDYEFFHGNDSTQKNQLILQISYGF